MTSETSEMKFFVEYVKKAYEGVCTIDQEERIITISGVKFHPYILEDIRSQVPEGASVKFEEMRPFKVSQTKWLP